MAPSDSHSPPHPVGEVSARIAGALGRAWGNVKADAWPLFQAAGAASVAWLVARYGLEHSEPFFAPVAAIVALNTTVGERGLNAVRLLRGVFIGLAVGELIRHTLGHGPGTLGLGVFLSMATARATGGARVAISQAAVSAILCIAVVTDVGIQRLGDSLIGAGVALTFSQFLFSPEPVGLVWRGEAAALERMARGLALTAQALERDDEALFKVALRQLRDHRDDLAELSRVRRAGVAVAHHTVFWRSRRAELAAEDERASHLDLVGDSCLMLTRLTLTLPSAQRLAFAPIARELSVTLGELSKQSGDSSARRRAADQTLALLRRPESSAAIATPGAAVTAVWMIAVDLMGFAGVDPSGALEALRVS